MNSTIAREWWTERWLELLDKYRFKKRLERARNYAREGNVLSIEFRDQKVVAKVQGSEAEPYQLSIWMDTFTDEEWNYVIETMSQRAIFAAKLLAGEMPDNIEEVFTANGLSLFPFTLQEVGSQCSCPDKANPCKHIGAVYYLLADRFSEDPFVLFQLRGRKKEQIIGQLRQLRSAEPEESNNNKSENEPESTNFQPPQIDQFWKYEAQLDPALVVIAPPPSNETIIDVLGTIPLPGSAGKAENAEAVMQYLQTVYQQVSQQAIMAALHLDN
ncbi:MAG: SWIM zinc finger family protein [Hormoscilla sp.]